jgi:hypothetical protein
MAMKKPIVLSDDGITFKPIADTDTLEMAALPLSAATGNKLTRRTDYPGLYVEGGIFNPLPTSSVRPGASATVVPRFDATYDAEVLQLMGNSTAFTVDVSGAPATITNKVGYRVRIMMSHGTADDTSFLKFKTISGSILSPDGALLSATRYAHPFGAINATRIVDLVYNLSLGWVLEEIMHPLPQVQVISDSISWTGPGSVDRSISLASLPYWMVSSSWGVQVGVRVLAYTANSGDAMTANCKVTIAGDVHLNETRQLPVGECMSFALATMVTHPTENGDGTIQFPDMRDVKFTLTTTASDVARLYYKVTLFRLPLGTHRAE